MTMFPGAGASIDYNEAGEPTSWDYPMDDAQSFYCDICGLNHEGGCPGDTEDDYEGHDSCHCGHPECGAC